MSQDEMYQEIRTWVNHTKEGYPRAEKDLVHFDILWHSISKVIMDLQKRKTPLNEEENDIVSLVKYEGTLYRIHKKYTPMAENYGVIETNHYVSWTKINDFNDFYWFNRDSKFITITAKTTPELFAIDLIGLNDYIRKYYSPSFSIGSPAILREQEVVFPILFSTIQDIIPNK